MHWRVLAAFITLGDFLLFAGIKRRSVYGILFKTKGWLLFWLLKKVTVQQGMPCSQRCKQLRKNSKYPTAQTDKNTAYPHPVPKVTSLPVQNPHTL